MIFVRNSKLICWTIVLPFIALTSVLAQTNSLARDKRWREDVRFYARELPKRHKNLFFQLPKQEFEREMKTLEARIPELSDSAVALELIRLTARVGDGHTASSMPVSTMTYFPFRLEQFEEGWFVTQTTDEYKTVLGGRLVKIGDVKIEQAAQLLRAFVSAENEIVVNVSAYY